MTEKEEKLIKKIQKDFPEFYQSLQSSSLDELKAKLTTHAKHRENTLKAREECEPLQAAKETARELAAPFNETLSNISMRTKYIYLLMREKGEE